MSSLPAVQRYNGGNSADDHLPAQSPRVVTDLAIPGRDANDVNRFLSGGMDRSDAYAVLDDIETLAATHDPSVAIQGVLGMPVEAAVYQFRVGGSQVSGISAKGARALAAYRGGFHIHSPVIENTYKKVKVSVDGEETLIEVPAYRATVEVTDLQKHTTFSASYSQAEMLALANGGWRFNEHAEQTAVSKATRNAILYHFAGVEAQVQKFVDESRKRGDALILGAVTSELDAASDAREAAKKHIDVRRSEPLGQMQAGLFKAEVERAIKEAEIAGTPVPKLGSDLIEFQTRQWGQGVKTADVPARDRERLYDWLNDRRTAIGLAPLPGYADADGVIEDESLPQDDETPPEDLFGDQ